MASSGSDEEMLPAEIKRYKLYDEDSSILIPLRSIYRLQKKQRRGTNYDDDDGLSNNGNRSTDGSSADSDDGSLANETSQLDIEIEFHGVEGRREPCSNTDTSSENEANNIEGDHNEEYNGRNVTNDRPCASVMMVSENSSMSVDQSVYDLIQYYIHFKVSKNALKESLRMQLNLLPECNFMPKTLHQLFKYAERIAPPCVVIKHFYCKACYCYVSDSSAEIKTCPKCNETKDRNCFFFEFDIRNQIKHLFENLNLSEKLKPPSLRHDSNIISDITDGSEYIRVNSRPHRGKYDLTLMINTDGLSLIKSARSHCWPVLCTIAELPRHLRECFIINLGLWYSKDRKPAMNTFFQPLCKKLQECYVDGIKCMNPITKTTIVSRVTAPLIIADAPARAVLQNIYNFNGLYGCNVCEIRTKKCRRVENEKTYRIYPFNNNARLRSGKRMEQQALQVSRLQKVHVRGVKGYSIFSCLPKLDLGTCFVPEYMHSVLLGVVRQIFNIYIHRPGQWNLKNCIGELDKFLAGIRPLLSFNRLPRRLSEAHFYKASEWYNLILYYSLPMLVNYLPEKYLQHLMALIIALFNLLQDHITSDDLAKSEELLQLFVKQIPILFIDRELTYNSHQLLHLALSVKRWGPLWATSAFPFENYNGLISKSVHGQKHMGQEIVKNVSIVQGLAIMKSRLQRPTGANENISLRNYDLLSVILKGVEQLSDKEEELFVREDIDYTKILLYARAKVKNELYTSGSYKDIKSDSHNVSITMLNGFKTYGSIRFFFEIDDDLCFVLQTFSVDHMKMFFHRKTNTTVRHIIPIKENDEIMMIRMKDVRQITQVIRVADYICKRPNTLHMVW